MAKAKAEVKLAKVRDEDVLDHLNDMTPEELKHFRECNAKHREEISRRKVRNLISGLIKRIIDLLAGIVGTILLLPLTLVVAIMRLVNHENGPIFYDQLRIGKNGKIFKMYKFRSMVIGADEILQDYLDNNPDAKKEYDINKKLKEDPRITKTGYFLRKTSLDEFPQFINILFGQMSLVGPRPYLPREKEDMGDYYKYIVQMKPGLTGPWQVAGRSNLTFEDRLKLDEEYCSRRGNRRDFIIILKTFKKVFHSEGAQ